MTNHLEMSEQCALNAQKAGAPIVRSIFERMSELHRLLDEEEKKLAEWLRNQDPSSIPTFIYRKPRN